MILGFDIGNTNTTLGIYREGRVAPVQTYRYTTHRSATADELGVAVNSFLSLYRNSSGDTTPVKGAAYSTVVTDLTETYRSMVRGFFAVEPLEINSSCRLGISIRYDNPELLGPDRIVNAEAAFAEHPADVIIIDMGTATTISVVTGDGTLNGGVIGPGIGITINALAEGTSRLHKINLEKPDSVIAYNTGDAIKSGFFYGWLSMIEGMVKRIEDHFGVPFLVITTGGFSTVLSPHLQIKVLNDPALTMKGIQYVFTRNNS